MKIAIASGKGGTGKTTLATNLAAYLAEKQPVVLCDLDVEEPNSGLFVTGERVHHEITNKAIPVWNREACTHCGDCQAVCNFNAILSMPSAVMVFPELCHACYACAELCPADALAMEPKPMGELGHFRNGALELIESRLMVGEEQAVPLIRHTLRYLAQRVPAEVQIILDCPPGTSCPVIESVKDADLVVLVTEPTPFGLHDLTLAVETVRHLGKSFAVVLNRDGIGDAGVLRYCQREGIDVIARIPNLREIAERYSAGELLYREIPEVRRALDHVVDYVRSRAEGGQR